MLVYETGYGYDFLSTRHYAIKLSEKIIEVIKMPERKKDRIVKSARVRVKKKFSLDLMLSKTINLYEELVARRENINY